MQVVLRDDVENLGHKGDVVDVADGYARNYLVPRGLAVKAGRGAAKQAVAMRRNRTIRDTREREAAHEVAGRISGRIVALTARAGEGGKLFGSVTATDLADAVLAQTGVEIDRRKIALDEPIKELGEVEIAVRLHADVTALLQVVVSAVE